VASTPRVPNRIANSASMSATPSIVSEYQWGATPGGLPVSTSMLMEMAVSCNAMYGMIAVSAMNVTRTATRRERPKRADRKSEIDVAF
jgi:hypothetical protein